MTDLDVTVATSEWRAGLISVLPHVCADDEVPMLQRVRLYVTEHGVFAAATDRFTAAVTHIDALEQASDTGCFDLGPTDAKEVLALFKPARDDTDATLRIEVREKDIRFTDVSGMFPGKQLRIIPPTVSQQFPDVAKMIGELRYVSSDYEWPLSVNGEYMARFAAAGKSYGMPLVLQPTKRAMVITCGSSFTGALMPVKLTDEGRTDLAERWNDWEDYRIACSAEHPAAPVEKATPDE